MILYPAIDLYQGKVVRLARGDFNAETVYSLNPAGQAKEWAEAGAEWIHVVDLEGAKTGLLRNLDSLRKIRKAVSCKIQFGGGLRSLSAVKEIFSEGIDRAVIGTKALDKSFFEALLGNYGDRVALGIDAKDGIVRTEGWLGMSGMTVEELLTSLYDTPVKTVIYTNIKNDGMLQGPDLRGLSDVLRWTQANVILSGGVSGIEDIEACRDIKENNFDGAIIGKALYERRFDLRSALTAASAGGRK